MLLVAVQGLVMHKRKQFRVRNPRDMLVEDSKRQEHGSCSVSMAFVPLSVVVLPGGRRASSPRRSLCSLYNDPKQRVYNVVLKQAAMMEEKTKANAALQDAYDRCRGVCADYSKTFYLGTLLMTPSRRRAIWAIDVWCRRTDELVDGLNASLVGPSALDQWEARLEELFDGRPYGMFDAALSDTVSTFSIDIQPFRDMIEGMRMDLNKSRYKNFDELYLYCYYVAGTVGLMSVPVMGITPKSQTSIKSTFNGALALGIANQLTNILRDVGEEGRIYLPQDELSKFCLSDEDVFSGKVTDKWRSFMKNQIKRARMFFNQAEEGVVELSRVSRWPVLASLILYRQILNEIEANDYNNFTKRACVSKVKKLMVLPVAYARSLQLPWSQHQKGLTEL